jgi:hypothetical protein
MATAAVTCIEKSPDFFGGLALAVKERVHLVHQERRHPDFCADPAE